MTEFERVYINSLGDYAIEFELIYYVKTCNKSEFRQVEHEIHVKILNNFAELEIEIPYPKYETLHGRQSKQKGMITSKTAFN